MEWNLCTDEHEVFYERLADSLLAESRKFRRDLDTKLDDIDRDLERLIPGYKAPGLRGGG